MVSTLLLFFVQFLIFDVDCYLAGMMGCGPAGVLDIHLMMYPLLPPLGMGLTSVLYKHCSVPCSVLLFYFEYSLYFLDLDKSVRT